MCRSARTCVNIDPVRGSSCRHESAGAESARTCDAEQQPPRGRHGSAMLHVCVWHCRMRSALQPSWPLVHDIARQWSLDKPQGMLSLDNWMAAHTLLPHLCVHTGGDTAGVP